jgi:hypothetical protein
MVRLVLVTLGLGALGCPSFVAFDPGFNGSLLLDGPRLRACGQGGCWISDGSGLQRVRKSSFYNHDIQMAVTRGEALLMAGDANSSSLQIALSDGTTRSLPEGFGFEGPNHIVRGWGSSVEGSWMAVTSWTGDDVEGCTKVKDLPCTKSFVLAQGLMPIRMPTDCEAGASSTDPLVVRTQSGFRVVMGPLPGPLEEIATQTGFVCSFDQLNSRWSIETSPALETAPAFQIGTSTPNGEPLVILVGPGGIRIAEVRSTGVLEVSSFSIQDMFYAVARPSVPGKALVAASHGPSRVLSVWSLDLRTLDFSGEESLGTQLSPQAVARADDGTSYLLAADIKDIGDRNKADETPLVLFRHDGASWH